MIIKLRDKQYKDYDIHSNVDSYYKIGNDLLIIVYKNGKSCVKKLDYWEIAEIIQ